MVSRGRVIPSAARDLSGTEGSLAALGMTRLPGFLSLVHVDDHAAAYFSFEDFWAQRRQVAEAGLAHRAVELVERQVTAESPPRLLARRLGQHHRIDAVHRHA